MVTRYSIKIKRYIFEAGMLKVYVIEYEEIAVNENDHHCKEIFRVSNSAWW